MPRRMREHHARIRLAQRTEIGSFKELQQVVKEKKFEFLMRQSCSRSLCWATINSEDIFFILNRQRGTIITVLTKEQAVSLMNDNAR